MNTNVYQPFIRGSGNAAASIEKALCILGAQERPYTLLTPVRIPRDADLAKIHADIPPHVEGLLFIANPHGLHTDYLKNAIHNRFIKIICEKPVCVTADELEVLADLPDDIGVFHGYRQLWGPQTIRDLIVRGELGRLFSIEGQYLQASATAEHRPKNWKDDPKLAGPHDVFLDLMPHWIDLSNYLVGKPSSCAKVKRMFPHATSTHRDSHIHLMLDYDDGIAGLASISKSFHGAGNDLTIHVLGQKARCTWSFQNPDQILIAKQKSIQTIARNEAGVAKMPPFHGLGWLEGYIEVIDAYLTRDRSYPNLKDAKFVMKALFQALEQ